MSWLLSSKMTPGVNFDRSANDLIPWMSIFEAVKALTLSVTFERLCSRREAVTTTSEMLVADDADVDAGVLWAFAGWPINSGAAAEAASKAPMRQDGFDVIGTPGD